MGDDGEAWAQFPPRTIAVVQAAINAGLIPQTALQDNEVSDNGWATFPPRVIQVVNGAITAGKIVLPPAPPLVVPVSFQQAHAASNGNWTPSPALQPNDIIIAASMGNTQFPTTEQSGWVQYVNSSGTPGVPDQPSSGAYLKIYMRTVTPLDGATFTLGGDSAGSFVWAAFRGSCGISGLASLKTADDGTPTSNSLTNPIYTSGVGDMAIFIVGFGADAGTVDYDGFPPTGYTQAAKNPGVSGSSFGSYLAYKDVSALNTGTIAAAAINAVASSAKWGVRLLTLAALDNAGQA